MIRGGRVRVTFEGHRTKQKKAKIALPIAAVLIAGLTYCVKEILRANLQELRDSLARAESQFRIEGGQSAISVQILRAQQQVETLKLQDEAAQGKIDPHRDFSALIAQDTGAAQQTLGQLNGNFDSASRLIDAMPSAAKDLRILTLREQTRASVDKVNEQVKELLKLSPEHDVVYRFARVKMALVIALVEEVAVLVLGDAAVTAARRIQDATEYSRVFGSNLRLAVSGGSAHTLRCHNRQKDGHR
jgi:hypothetical protein